MRGRSGAPYRRSTQDSIRKRTQFRRTSISSTKAWDLPRVPPRPLPEAAQTSRSPLPLLSSVPMLARRRQFLPSSLKLLRPASKQPPAASPHSPLLPTSTPSTPSSPTLSATLRLDDLVLRHSRRCERSTLRSTASSPRERAWYRWARVGRAVSLQTVSGRCVDRSGSSSLTSC